MKTGWHEPRYFSRHLTSSTLAVYIFSGLSPNSKKILRSVLVMALHGPHHP
jgi:hypothetical protein